MDVNGEARLADIVLDRQPAERRVEAAQCRPRDQIDLPEAECRASFDRLAQQRCGYALLAHSFIHPKRGKPRRQLRTRRFVVVDDQRIAADLALALGDEGEGNASPGFEEVLEPVADRLQRLAFVPPECPPDPLGDGVGMLRAVAQIVDRDTQVLFPSFFDSLLK